MIRALLLACFAMTLLSTPVLAGGGGKKDASLKVTNDTTSPYLVIANPSTAFLAKIAGGGVPTLAEFQAQGGQVVLAGATGTLKIKSGSNDVYVVKVNGTTPDIANFKKKTITATKNQTLTSKISDLIK